MVLWEIICTTKYYTLFIVVNDRITITSLLHILTVFVICKIAHEMISP